MVGNRPSRLPENHENLLQNVQEGVDKNTDALVKQQAIRMIAELDGKTKYQIQMTDKYGKYRIVIENNDIPIDFNPKDPRLFEKIKKIGNGLVECLNEKRIKLDGRIGDRIIVDDGIIWDSGILSSYDLVPENPADKNVKMNKQTIESTFRILMKVRGEEITKENIKKAICANNKLTQACVDAYK